MAMIILTDRYFERSSLFPIQRMYFFMKSINENAADFVF